MRPGGPYFQLARGRAMVARRSMRVARSAKLVGDTVGMQCAVTRARHAVREWRFWRRMHLEYERDMARKACTCCGATELESHGAESGVCDACKRHCKGGV